MERREQVRWAAPNGVHLFLLAVVSADIKRPVREMGGVLVHWTEYPLLADLDVFVETHRFISQAQAPSYGLREALVGWNECLQTLANRSQQTPAAANK